MAKKAMTNCLVCGKEFEQCHTCNKNIDEMYQWRRVVCCPEHFSYHLPVIQYVRKQITKTEAKAELSKAIEDYGEIEFVDNIKSVVVEILAEEKKPKSKKKTAVVDEPAIENEGERIENDGLEVPFTGEII